MEITTRTTCRLCYRDTLVPLFSLGAQYVSNFVDKADIHSGIKCPIELVLCTHCSMVQLKHTAPQEILYSRNYWYKSGVTDTMRAALRDVTRAAEKHVQIVPGDVMLDIGSNDGTLLRSYTMRSTIKVGVEPADNLQEEGRNGLDVILHDFWPLGNESIGALRAQGIDLFNQNKAKVITACGMFYDLENPNAFIADVAMALHPNGVFIAQLMCLKNMLNIGDIGNLAHEHLEFYSLKSLQYLFSINGLKIVDMEKNNVNGESYRIYARPEKAPYQISPNVGAFFAEEQGLDQLDTYATFFATMEANKKACVPFIRDEVAKGKRVWVYGASTKGNVILQYYGLDHTLIEGAADRSPSKWGKYTVGSGIPIYSEEDARKRRPDYFLILPYAFTPEFVKREADWLSAGGKFLVPLPEFRIIG